MSDREAQPDSKVHRADGRLHLVHYVTDESGDRVPVVLGPWKVEFGLEDLGQLIAGACVMALPIATTGKVWDLRSQLSLGRTLLILALSVLTLGALIWSLFYGKRITDFPGHFIKRALSAYLVTFAMSFVLLWLFDKAPLDDLRVARMRAIRVGFPASFAGTVVYSRN